MIERRSLSACYSNTPPKHLALRVLAQLNKGALDQHSHIPNINPEKLETRCRVMAELCKSCAILEPENRLWEYASEFFQVFPQGKTRVWQLLERWGMKIKQDKSIKAPPVFDSFRYPLEFMDMPSCYNSDGFFKGKKVTEYLNDEGERKFKAQLRWASDNCWTQLEQTKRLLRVGTQSLVASDYCKELVEVTGKNKAVVLIGPDIEELRILAEKGYKVIGIDRIFSPQIRGGILNGNIISLGRETENGKIAFDQVPVGKIGFVQADIEKEGLRFLPNEALTIGEKNMIHHMPAASRIRTISEIARQLRENGGAMVFNEPWNNLTLVEMVWGANPHRETTIWDGMIISHIYGAQTPESLTALVKEACPTIKSKVQKVPLIPPLAFSLVREKILTYQAVQLVASF